MLLPDLRREWCILHGKLEGPLFASEGYLHRCLVHLVRITESAGDLLDLTAVVLDLHDLMRSVPVS